MKIDILTLFPEMFKGPFDASMLKKAQEKALVEINIHNLRDWAKDKHKTTDDRPFGGGKGMVIKVDVVYKAIKELKAQKSKTKSGVEKLKVILLSPQGKVFNQKKAQELSKIDHLILIAGHYEGFDERIREHLIDEEISIGDYILTGGEIPAMVITDSIVRLLPSVLEEETTLNESFSPTTHNSQPISLLDYPVYTRPENFKGWKVPKVLLSGNHAKIAKWRKEKATESTHKKRPDLL
jgi:tRNA (guanine37-N1)-methyltransferase